MQISLEKTKYYQYKIDFTDSDFNEALSFCRYLKEQFGWEDITFSEKAWRFNKKVFISIIKSKFLDTVVDDNVLLSFEQIKINEKKNELIEKKVDVIKKAKTSNIEIKGIKGELYDFQKIAVEFLIANNGRGMVAYDVGLGKELFYKTLVATPNGWEKIKNLKINDYVIGRDGNKTRITGIYPQGRKKLYRFTLTDGSSCLCGIEHLWNIKNKNDPYYNKDWQTVTTKGLLKRKIVNNKGESQYIIPFAKPIQFKKRNFYISPYTLGALIGDGALTCSSVHISIPKNKKHILDKIKKEHPEYAYPISVYSCPRASFTNGRTSCNKMKRNIKKLGLNIKSPFRFIPKKYKIGSMQQRLDMLRGLMDTDGSASKNRITFHTMSLKLAEDVVEIVRSLGGESNVRSYDRTKDNKGIEYQVNIKLDIFCPFSKESYKAKNWWVAKNRGKYGRHIKKIEYERIDKAICIAVDALDKLYVIKDSIVTHNTLVSIASIVHTKKDKSLIICPMSIKYSWQNEINKWSKLKSFVVDSSKNFNLKDYQENDVIILNYDIIKKHFDLLSSINFDCMVLDESQRVKNPKIIRSKLCKKLSEKIDSTILLTATPILSTPIELYQQLNIIDPTEWNNYYGYAKRYCAMWRSPWGLNVSGKSNILELKQKISKHIIRKKREDVFDQLPDKNFIDIPIELNSDIKNKYEILEDSFVDYLRDIKNKTDKEIKKSMQAQVLVKLGELRRLTSLGKIDDAKEIIKNIINSGEKIIVFSTYNEPLIDLQNIFEKESVIIIGSNNSIDRQKAIDEFQNNPKIKIFFGGMLSANTGITLTESNNVLFLDFAWTPADMHQAVGRCDRIGQKASKINIYQLIALNTIDQKMAKILKKKQALIDVLIEGKEDVKNKSTNSIKDLLKEYSK